MPDSLIVIRSGATDYEVQGRIRGAVDIPLAAAGVAEVERTIPLLAAAAPAALYCSRASCAADTARLIGDAIGLRARAVSELGNLDQGLWQGLLVEDIRRKQPRVARQWQDNPWAVAPPEGELLEEACDRVERALHKLFRRHGSGRVALVVPRPLDRVVRWLVAAEPLGDLWACDADGPLAAEVPVAGQWRRSTRTGQDGDRRRIPAQSRA
jgi:broad specificity phosphatase PhoE